MPARSLLRSAGTVFLGLALACSRGEPPAEEAPPAEPRVLELESALIALPDSVRLAVVTLDRSLPADLEPQLVELRAGDIVRFQSADAAAHAIGFAGDLLQPEARDYLEVTGQLRSPPLLGAGTAWVVSFAGAPPGVYPFSCVTHGAPGRIVVLPR